MTAAAAFTGVLWPEGRYWRHTRDGDRQALALYERHYSARRYRDGRRRRLFVGPGQKMVLLSFDGRALFAQVSSSNPGYCFLQAGWRRCGVTRGGHGRAVQLILEALPGMAG